MKHLKPHSKLCQSLFRLDAVYWLKLLPGIDRLCKEPNTSTLWQIAREWHNLYDMPSLLQYHFTHGIGESYLETHQNCWVRL